MKEKMSLFKISARKMNAVKGSEGMCGCACHMVNCGGSSTADNNAANNKKDLCSIGHPCE